jgi:NAD(P)-dependent dehydrogenase (short-subunit alcohol dehydrogenase family)
MKMDNSMLGLTGKNILVLGGGFGMGESSSMLLARAGANVAVVDLDLARAERVAAAVGELGRKNVAISVDVTDDVRLVDAIARAERELGALDGMATVIGMAGWAPLLEMTPADWDLDQGRNLRYFFVAGTEVARRMIARGGAGSIVCITSVDGIQSAPYHASYGAAKAGLVNLVRSMAAEWSRHGVRVNAIAPGAIMTPRFPLRTPDEEAQMTQALPIRRRGTTDDIGKSVLFMLSDLANYVTGQTLAVDGGFTAVGPFDYGVQMDRVRASQKLALDAQR